MNNNTEYYISKNTQHELLLTSKLIFAQRFRKLLKRLTFQKNNNFGQYIRTQGIPDIVSTILYGSMHVKHFSKDEWETKIVSLPTTSIYGCDEVMVKQFKEDFVTRKDTRLFVMDFSEADFLGHAYGSNSKDYKSAIQRVDKRIGDVVDWLKKNESADDTAIVVCSDHGMYNIDHSYLLFD